MKMETREANEQNGSREQAVIAQCIRSSKVKMSRTVVRGAILRHPLAQSVCVCAAVTLEKLL